MGGDKFVVLALSQFCSAGGLPPPGPDLLADLLARYEAPVGRHLFRVTGDRELAADLAQETFLRALAVLRRGASFANARAWLYRVATNLAVDALRRRARLGSLGPFDGAGSASLEDQVAERDLVRQALAAVPPKLAACLALTAVEGLSYAEAAEILGISAEAVRKRVHRGRSPSAGPMTD